jgi:serine/threonine protein kinase
MPGSSSTRPFGAAITEQGRVLGFREYMAPEQARGEHVDARTDVFSIESCSTKW